MQLIFWGIMLMPAILGVAALLYERRRLMRAQEAKCR